MSLIYNDTTGKLGSSNALRSAKDAKDETKI
jgi:hypothetical protein